MKRVLVTGASGDIGSAIVKHLVQIEYSVLGLDIVPPRNGNEFEHFVRVDLRKELEIERMCQEVNDNYSPLWALVHCAGIYPIRPFEDYNLELWDEVNAVNLRSIFHITQLLQQSIVRGGRIVVVSSGAAHVGSRDVGYSSSKAGVVGLTRSLAKALASRGILVNAVCPGVIKTQMSARMSPKDQEEYIDKITLKRIGLPEEVSICISFLLDRQNTYMTGASIDVNGGLYMR